MEKNKPQHEREREDPLLGNPIDESITPQPRKREISRNENRISKKNNHKRISFVILVIVKQLEKREQCRSI